MFGFCGSLENVRLKTAQDAQERKPTLLSHDRF
jgi:hypothetical protein